MLVVEHDVQASSLKAINRGSITDLHTLVTINLKEILIVGTVKDAKGQPIPGVTVMVKGTQTGTSTDAVGHYKINVPGENATLVFSAVGYATQELLVGKKTAFDVTLQENGRSLEEVIVVAYGTQKKSSSTAAVSTVKGDVLATAPVANISNSLAGNVAGVSMRPNGGQPGYDNPDLHIRGIGTTGSNGPLIVIDGIQRNNISQIDPESVESVTVLKDAAAVAPYGLAGANGVFLITTKRGKTGAPTLTFNLQYGVQNPTYVPKPLNAQDYMRLTDEAYLNDGGSPTTLTYPQATIDNYVNLNAQNPDLYPSSNAVASVPNKNTPTAQSNLQLTGGTKDVKYFANIGVLNQQGMFSAESYRRYDYNLNLDVNATATTTVSGSIHGAFENTNSIDASTSTPQLFRGLLKYIPNQALVWSNGQYGASAGNSPYGVLNSGGYYRKNQTTELITISIEQKLPFIKGLSVKADFAYDPYNYIEKGWHQPYFYSVVNTTTTPYTFSSAIATSEGSATQTTSLYENYYANNSFTYHGYVNYHNTFGKSDITGLLVVEEKNNSQLNFGASLNNYQLTIDELNFGSSNANDRGLNGSSSTGSQVGYVYRVDYAYDGKYLLEATGRYDGHYYFAPGHRYAYFPAFSAGWVISKEKFMSNVSFVDYLKLRGSWGKSGNLAGNPYQYLSGYNLYSNSYAFGNGQVVQGSYQPQEANPNLTWEVSAKTDIGLDATILKGLFTIGADYFTERRTGMLLAPSVTVPVEYGLALAQQNAGIMDNSGFEFTLATQHKFANGIAISMNGNFSYSKNKMVQIFESPSTYNNPNRRRTGRPFGEVFGYNAIKIFGTADDKNGDGIIDAKDGYNVTQFGTLHPGDIQYQDVNGDGKIDVNDQVPIGNPVYPAITYGFTPTISWKGVDLSLFFQGSAQESFNIGGIFQTTPFASNNSNTSYQYYNNRWTPTHQNALYPRVDSSPYANNTQGSNWWIINTGYLRLKTASLGYTLPSSIIKRIGMTRLRVFVTAQNYLTFSKLNFMDPEQGYSSGETAYPNQKVITTGLSASF
ncbi:SusC/RagA family TonB-linked outer membrane protein [Mucilaginibacter sp. PPCGB 2223]|nr:SusC/RagA family TonB-linked outer membrane protein [Mucilaginibacter sp. PPCGB 2223]